jgi:hypothetical protein
MVKRQKSKDTLLLYTKIVRRSSRSGEKDQNRSKKPFIIAYKHKIVIVSRFTVAFFFGM